MNTIDLKVFKTTFKNHHDYSSADMKTSIQTYVFIAACLEQSGWDLFLAVLR